ncbi:hypothetical protein K491DRAFT_711651 [Lophiostoma macrostomum CBS 122681]|uniref:BTB domain-containing protein n=1 Tax=Lophiostoma macrostomum CBS 122681 TaxID=1314788 RepID=A0A6A6TK77_9PLEO|nr:hypothetical protein K491DRAFT_711651 [Lophiostoma macrostomum CBS 122681]
MPPHIPASSLYTTVDRRSLLELLGGPGVEVHIGPKPSAEKQEQENRIWCLSQNWLAYHSRLFNLLATYSQQRSTVIIDSEPRIFDKFVKFMLCGRYSHSQKLGEVDKVRESAKVWVLGSKLDAPKFMNVAMKNMHYTYNNYHRLDPLASIGPITVQYVCDNVVPGEPLYDFFRDVVVTYWARGSVLKHGRDFKSSVDYEKQWGEIFGKYPSFQNDLLTRLGRAGSHIKPLPAYLVPEDVESVVSRPESAPPPNVP